jgi:UDP-galactopyranose mutase
VKPKYDFLIVGAGIFGSTCAYELTKRGKKCLVIDKRDVIGGNCYTENVNGIHVHKYGAHIFHTNDKELWDYVNQFAVFKQYTHNVIANYNGEMYTLPFNMWTFNQLWNVTKPEEAKQILKGQTYLGEVTNLQEQSCSELPPSIIKRLPVRYTWDSNYFDDKFTGMPVGGYTQIFEKMLEGCDVMLNTDYFDDQLSFDVLAERTIYTGPIDKFFNYQHGKLEYRSLEWETKTLDEDNFQGVPVMNYTDEVTPYTRILEHKWFDYQKQKGTVISYEYPKDYNGDNEPYYPIRDDKNVEIYEKYKDLTKSLKTHIFGGRLGSYVYYDMHQVIAQALKLIKDLDNTETK